MNNGLVGFPNIWITVPKTVNIDFIQQILDEYFKVG
jgi:hypothetical protein